MHNSLLCYDLGPGVTAFSTTRKGGCSAGAYGELNINAYCGDTPEHISRNRELLCQRLGLKSDARLVMPHQTHADEVRRVAPDFLLLHSEARQERLEGVDALMTDVEEVCIGVSTADCTPIIIYSPQRRCAAVVHAGWRGTARRIVQKAVGQLAATFGCDTALLKAVIGPTISLKNFEVGPEVYEAFRQEGFPMEQIALQMPAKDDASSQKWHIDLPLCNRLQLVETGLPEANISDCGICTYDHADEFFSARRLGLHSGRIFTGIILRSRN